MADKNSQFLFISANYRFHEAGLSSGSIQKKTRTHVRKIGSAIQYRAYDKERILQEIDNKLTHHISAAAQNKSLKAEIDKIKSASVTMKDIQIKKSSKKIKVPSSTGLLKNRAFTSCIHSTLVGLNSENAQLGREIELMSKQVQEMKKKETYSIFQELFTQYSIFKYEMNRLKSILKDRKKQKMLAKREMSKVLNDKIKQILDKKRGVEELSVETSQLKGHLDSILQELAHFRNKNREIMKTKKRLSEDIDSIAIKIQTDFPEFSRSILEPVEKMEKRKHEAQSTSPATIMQVHEQDNSFSHSKQSPTNNSPLHKPTFSQVNKLDDDSDSDYGEQDEYDEYDEDDQDEDMNQEICDEHEQEKCLQGSKF